MGQRANYAIVENGQYQLYYSHWAANTITRDLFWGPAFARIFIEQQTKLAPDEWLDDIWCEGGAAVNFDCRLLTLFGGEDVNYEIPLRRLFLKLLEQAWAPWKVNWTLAGIVGLAEATGYPTERVLSPAKPTSHSVEVHALSDAEKDNFDCVLITSSNGADTLRICRVPAYDLQDLLYSEDVMQVLASLPSLERFVAPADNWPRHGVHLAMSTHGLTIWTTSADPRLGSRVSANWPHWTVHHDADHYEHQVRHAPERIHFVEPLPSGLLNNLRTMLLHEPDQGAVSSFLSLTRLLDKSGKEISDINPATMLHTDWLPPHDVRERIIDSAIKQMDSKS